MYKILKSNLKGGIPIKFCSFGQMTERRYETLYLKEPNTIEWIDSFPSEAHFWDIGANIGLYTIYAAITKGISVAAFEPGFSNYFVLNKNIEINFLFDQVTAYSVALTDRAEIGTLNMGTTVPASSSNSFNDNKNDQAKEIDISFKQGMIGFSADNFIDLFNIKKPTHIKIDVDGLEHKVIDGMKKLLTDAIVKGISVELDTSRNEYCEGVIAQIEKTGLKFVNASRSKIIAPNSPIKNHYFAR